MTKNPLENLQIMIIDDDPSLRAALKKYLGVVHNISESGSNAEARTFLQSLKMPLNIALLDKGLPDGNGLDLIPLLLQSSPDVAIIVLTGDGNYRAVQESLKLGAHDFLVKSENLVEELTLRIPIAMAHAQVKQLDRGSLAKAAALLPSPLHPANAESYANFLRLCEKSYLDLAIQGNNGKLQETASNIGLARSTLWKKMSELGLEENSWGSRQ